MRPLLPLALLLALAAPASAGFAGLAPGLAGAGELAGVTYYPAWPLLTLELQELAAAHPDIVRLHSAGVSAKGMDLWLVEVADFENPARVPLEDREVLWVDGGTHANEYSGVMFVVHLLRWLAEGYGQNETATWIVEHRRTFIMPLLNPEGSLNGIGRLNDNLVNINRNYPVGWGDLEEAPVVNNPGPYPASEAETRITMAWWAQVRPDYVASIHCCGNLWLYPYGIEGRDPHVDDVPMFARVCEEAFPEVREDCGPIWSTIYPASGSSVDTAYEQVGAVAFGYEMSGREALLLWGAPFTTSDIEETESESWRGVLHAFLNVERYGAWPVVRVLGAAEGAVRLEVANEGWGNLTGGHLRLTDARGVAQVVALPRLASGARAELEVPGTFAEGAHALEVSYVKRPLAGEGTLRHTLGLARSGAGLAASLDGLAPSAAEEPRAVPLPALAPLAVLGLAALAARRR